MGSPQGCILSPILFACFIHDVCEQILNCKFNLYADDLQLRLVNEDLERIRHCPSITLWCSMCLRRR
jgi:hypothetical protein